MAGASKVASVAIASAGKPQASIVMGENAGELHKYAASELQKYFRQLTGAELPIIASADVSSRPAREALILLGGPAVNSAVREAEQSEMGEFHRSQARWIYHQNRSLQGSPRRRFRGQ